MDLGACPTGDGGRLTVRRSPRTLKRYVRCTNYDECGTSYPLPQNGDIEVTGEICEPCGSPVIIAHTRKGPWKICIDPACSTKAEKNKAREEKAKAKAGAKGTTSKKKPAASKAKKATKPSAAKSKTAKAPAKGKKKSSES